MFGLLRLTRNFLLLCLIAVLASAAACFVTAGRLLVDPGASRAVETADAIFVLSGSNADRWLEAYDLWREQRAPRIVLSPGLRDAGEQELARRGVRVPTGADIARAVLTRDLGVPATAVEIVQTPLDNTAAEATAIASLAAARGWTRVIVVTSLPHTRRTRIAMERALEPVGVAVQVRGSRYDAFSPSRWWRDRGDVRWIVTELPKLVAYKLGLGE